VPVCVRLLFYTSNRIAVLIIIIIIIILIYSTRETLYYYYIITYIKIKLNGQIARCVLYEMSACYTQHLRLYYYYYYVWRQSQWYIILLCSRFAIYFVCVFLYFQLSLKKYRVALYCINKAGRRRRIYSCSDTRRGAEHYV